MGNKWKQSNNFKLIQRFFAQATPQAEKPVASERPGGEGKEERGELPGVAVVEAIAWTPPPEFLEPNYLLFFARLVAGFLFLQLSEIMAEVSFLEVTAQLPHSEETHRRGALFASAVYLLGWLVSRQVIFFQLAVIGVAGFPRTASHHHHPQRCAPVHSGVRAAVVPVAAESGQRDVVPHHRFQDVGRLQGPSSVPPGPAHARRAPPATATAAGPATATTTTQ